MTIKIRAVLPTTYLFRLGVLTMIFYKHFYIVLGEIVYKITRSIIPLRDTNYNDYYPFEAVIDLSFSRSPSKLNYSCMKCAMDSNI